MLQNFMYTNFSQNQRTISTFFPYWRNSWNNELCQVFLFFFFGSYLHLKFSLLSIADTDICIISWIVSAITNGNHRYYTTCQFITCKHYWKMSICLQFQTRKITYIFSPLQFCHLLYRIKFSWKVTCRKSTNFCSLKEMFKWSVWYSRQ